MVSVMSPETAEIMMQRIEQATRQATREAQPASKADIDRLFDELRRLQDAVGVLQRNGTSSATSP
jgi:hypothetical protein